MEGKKSSIFDNVPAKFLGEWVERIAGKKGVRIERIVSRGHASPEGFWFDQAETEWVFVAQGAARVRFEEGDRMVEMGPGDHIIIPPRSRHRVDWTTPDEVTIWIAVFY